MKLIPKVTTSIREYNRLVGLSVNTRPKHSIHALYNPQNCVIWMRHKNLLSLFHETVHHVEWLLTMGDRFISLRLFGDFLDTVFDCVWNVLRWGYPGRPLNWYFRWYMLREMRYSFDEWLIWVLCK